MDLAKIKFGRFEGPGAADFVPNYPIVKSPREQNWIKTPNGLDKTQKSPKEKIQIEKKILTSSDIAHENLVLCPGAFRKFIINHLELLFIRVEFGMGFSRDPEFRKLLILRFSNHQNFPKIPGIRDFSGMSGIQDLTKNADFRDITKIKISNPGHENRRTRKFKENPDSQDFEIFRILWYIESLSLKFGIFGDSAF